MVDTNSNSEIHSETLIIWCRCYYMNTGRYGESLHEKCFCDECEKPIACSVCCGDDNITKEEVKQAEIKYFGIFVCEEHEEVAIWVVADRRD